LGKLNLSSKYNLCLVWKDMADEVWRSIDVDKRFGVISTLEDLEHAGVLASGGYIDRVDTLVLKSVDVSGIPRNVLNNLIKIVKYGIGLKDVSGWKTSMLDYANCQDLSIIDMKLESGLVKRKRPIKVFNLVHLENVRGNLQELFVNITREHADSGFGLMLINMDVSAVSCSHVNSLFKNASYEIFLHTVTGCNIEMLKDIDCIQLKIEDMEIHGSDDTESWQNFTVASFRFSKARGLIHCLMEKIIKQFPRSCIQDYVYFCSRSGDAYDGGIIQDS